MRFTEEVIESSGVAAFICICLYDRFSLHWFLHRGLDSLVLLSILQVLYSVIDLDWENNWDIFIALKITISISHTAHCGGPSSDRVE